MNKTILKQAAIYGYATCTMTEKDKIMLNMCMCEQADRHNSGYSSLCLDIR
jgi:hypothetical protein